MKKGDSEWSPFLFGMVTRKYPTPLFMIKEFNSYLETNPFDLLKTILFSIFFLSSFVGWGQRLTKNLNNNQILDEIKFLLKVDSIVIEDGILVFNDSYYFDKDTLKQFINGTWDLNEVDYNLISQGFICFNFLGPNYFLSVRCKDGSNCIYSTNKESYEWNDELLIPVFYGKKKSKKVERLFEGLE